MVTDEPIGILLDYIGYKPGLVLGILCGAVTAIIAMLSSNMILFFIGIVFFALAWNIVTHASSAYLLYSTPKRIAGRTFGFYESMDSTGGFIATFFIGFIALWGFFKVGLFFLLVLLLALFLVVIILKPEKRKYDKNTLRGFETYWHSPSKWKRGLKAMKEFSPISWVAAFDGFVGYTISATIWFVIPLSLVLFKNPFVPEGLALGVFEFTGIIFSAVGGYLADRYSKKKLFLSLLLITSAAAIILGFAPNLWVFFIFAFILSASNDTASAPIDSMLSQVDKKHDKDGTIWGFTGIFEDAGFIVGPIISGLLFKSFGLQGVFIFLGVLVFIDWMYSSWMLKDFKSNHKSL